MSSSERAVLVAAAVAAVNKAKEYARDNPEAASGTIDKAESVRGKAGPKYADTVGKGTQALRQGLGLATWRPPPAARHRRPRRRRHVSAPTDDAGPGARAGFDPAI